MWYCIECGSPATDSPTGKDEDGHFTSIDVRERYSLGYCPCTTDRRVAVVKDKQRAMDIACGLDTFLR